MTTRQPLKSSSDDLDYKDGRVTREVVEGLIDGDPRAFDITYLTYRDPLLGFVSRLVNSYATGEEIVQELFVTLWEKRSTIDPGQGIKRFLFVMARNRSIDFLRKNKKMRALSVSLDEAEGVGTSSTTPDQPMLERELTIMLDISLSNMPEQRRAVYQLSLDGLDTSEIAEQLGITRENVRQHLSRARRDLASLQSLTLFFLLS